MSLPDKFTFIAYDCTADEVYVAEVNGSDVSVTWDWPNGRKGDVSYTLKQVQEIINGGDWKMVNAPNGVDAKGNRLFFGEENLEVGMRVVLRNAQTYIVMPNVQKSVTDIKFVLINDGWTKFRTGEFSTDRISHSYCAVEVYKAPSSNGLLLDQTKQGELIWKYVPPKSEEQIKLEKEIEQGEKYVKNTQAQVEALKHKLAALQK